MKKRIHAMVLFAAVVTFSFACTTAPTNLSTNSSAPANSSVPAELKPALDAITANDIMQHTKVISADEYEGRGPGTKGEELTVKYLTEQYQRIGLKPGNPDGTFIQKVPLVGFTGAPTASFTVGSKQLNLTFPKTTLRFHAGSFPNQRLRIPTWFLLDMAWWRQSTGGTITKDWT